MCYVVMVAVVVWVVLQVASVLIGRALGVQCRMRESSDSGAHISTLSGSADDPADYVVGWLIIVTMLAMSSALGYMVGVRRGEKSRGLVDEHTALLTKC